MPTRYWVNDFPRRQGACRDWASFVTLCAASACRDYPITVQVCPVCQPILDRIPSRRGGGLGAVPGKAGGRAPARGLCRVRGCARPAQRPSDRPGSRPRAGWDPVRPDAVQLADGPSEREPFTSPCTTTPRSRNCSPTQRGPRRRGPGRPATNPELLYTFPADGKPYRYLFDVPVEVLRLRPHRVDAATAERARGAA